MTGFVQFPRLFARNILRNVAAVETRRRVPDRVITLEPRVDHFTSVAKMVDTRPVLFFDIDNTLYSKSKKIQDLMGELIDKYFMENLSLTFEDANHLHAKYFKDYGLAIEGLVRHHKVDPLEYNSKVDDALPLDDILSEDPGLRKLIQAIDKSKVRLWLFTNAFITHGRRVVKLLGVDDLFEGITYCDYESRQFVCKPHPAMFEKAQKDAGVSSTSQCYLIDDSALNCRGSVNVGWTAIHLVEPPELLPEKPAAQYQVTSLDELKAIFPQFFKDA